MSETDLFAGQLRSQGYRLTPQRLVILKILYDSKVHLSPMDIFSRAKKQLPGLTETTVYRTLTFLASQGLVMAAHIGNGQFVYEIAQYNHHHLICRSCGQMCEISNNDLQSLCQQLQRITGYRIDSVHLTFFGICPSCKDK